MNNTTFKTRALKTLEYTKIIELLAEHAVSTSGKELACALLPSADYATVSQRLRETRESHELIVRRGSLPLGGIRHITQALQRIRLGGVLNIEELINIEDCLRVARRVSHYWHHKPEENALIIDVSSHFEAILPIEGLEREISRCIQPPDGMKDEASPTLADIRRRVRSCNERIKEQLSRIIHSNDYKNMLQDTVITTRGGRYVVPIKQEYRNSFAGMIHDQSSSGSTLFIEPAAVVQMNNKIKELLLEESLEVDKILRRLSGLASEHVEELETNQSCLTTLDFIFAKGELALQMNAYAPELSTERSFNILKGRHPLIPREAVVPTNIRLGKDFTALMITGPNTGGKTVALKTLGLFALMCQAGLHIPAGEGTQMPVLSGVFADIGDEQSIEQSLSTFSSHMVNIVDILGNVGENSLVLLDELGAGTDPAEGAALAISIIEELLRKNVLTAVSTHYSELKVFALGREGVENASCEFDVETLRPTYRLLIGIPGKSNAFAISQKLGLPSDIIDFARERLSASDIRFEDVLTDLEISRKTMEQERERAESLMEETQKLRAEAATQRDRLAAQRDKIIQSARQEARSIIHSAKVEADTIIRDLRKSARTATIGEADNLRTKLADSLKEASALADAPNKNDKPKREKLNPSSLSKGDSVYIESLGQHGSVLGEADNSGRILVQAGMMKMKVSITDLSTATPAASKRARQASSASFAGDFTSRHRSESTSSEINLLGCTVDEALERADKYLDSAYLSGLGQVRIIHGKGTGALKTAIQTYLRSHPLVASHRLGGQGEGDTGVTVVEFMKG